MQSGSCSAMVRRPGFVVFGLFFCVISTAGCPQRELKPLTPCNTAGVVERVKVSQINNVDLLFVIDNSNSMQRNQAFLAQQLPKLVQALTSGDKDPTDNVDTQDFPPVKNLHLGVVTTDMGGNGATVETVPGFVTTSACGISRKALTYGATTVNRDYTVSGSSGSPVYLGDDGVMINWFNAEVNSQATGDSLALDMARINELKAAGCEDPANLKPDQRFLSFEVDPTWTPATLKTQSQKFANSFACRARIGSAGCNFEQPLESMLKALTDSKKDFTFFENTHGHLGATAAAYGVEPLNGGFIRSGSDSLLAVILVTDEDDCSSSTGELFGSTLENGNATLNVGCTREAQKLEADPKKSSSLMPVQRYVDQLLSLKSDPGLIVFAAITGLPLGDAEQYYTDPASTDYAALLNTPEMQYQEKVLPSYGTVPVEACSIAKYNYTAAPGRRVVKVAAALQDKQINTTVQSICNDFAPVIGSIIKLIGESLSGVCLPKPILRNTEGKVPCDVFETLPVPGSDTSFPTKCSELPGRTFVRNENGQEICKINQLAATAAQLADHAPLAACQTSTGESCGWYYDDFTNKVSASGVANPDSVEQTCPEVADSTRKGSQRITFAANSKPNSGSRIRFECLEQTQSIPADGLGKGIGSRCDGTTPCNGNQVCDDSTKTCQLSCTTTADCPMAYACDTNKTIHYCVNPVCGQ